MGKELYEADPDFGRLRSRSASELDPHLDWPLQEIVFAKGKKAQARLDDTDLRPARPLRDRGRPGEALARAAA